jgi:hypothetical protein
VGSTSDRQQCQKREEERVDLSGAERFRLPNRDLRHVRVFRIEEQVIVAANHHTGHTQHHALAGIVPGIPNDRRLRLLLHKMTAIDGEDLNLGNLLVCQAVIHALPGV